MQRQEPARSHGPWDSTAIRLGGLLLCLGALVFVLVAKAVDGSAGESSGGFSACVPRLPSPRTVDFAGLVKLHTTLLEPMARAGGRRYEGGVAAPEAFWSDASPQTIAAARGEGGTWPAGYEIRQWSSAGDDVAADVFRFRTPLQARELFDAASSARCHQHGKTAPAFSPPGARDLVWVNPDAALQGDVFLLRRSTVYRVAIVRDRRSLARSAPGQRPTTIAIANGLACELPGAGCAKAPPARRAHFGAKLKSSAPT